MNLNDIDLSDLDLFVQGVPHDAFETLRREAPVFRNREIDGPGFWVLSKYEDVAAASKDPATFSSARGGTNLFDLSDDDLIRIRTLMVNMDPPDHSKYRRLVNQGFTPRMVQKLKDHIRDTCRTIVDDIAEQGECDFVTKVAAELPLQVIAETLGVPLEDRHMVFDWSNRLIGYDDPEFQTSFEDGRIAAAEMWMYANELAQKRRESPQDDLVSALLRAEVDGVRLTEMEFDSFFLLLSVAGNETTRNLISGGMLALIQHPEQRARLMADRSLLNSAVEEMLRWVTPVMHFRRTTSRDVTIRGQRIPEGDKVALFYPGANRDEDVFRDPQQFDITRQPNDHLSFGMGEHFCLGANLARLEIRCMFDELLDRLPDIELAGPVRRLRSNFINGIKSMPVRFTPERRRATGTD